MDDEFSMLLRIHNSFGVPQLLDMVSSPVNAPRISSTAPEPIHEPHYDWMPISHVPSFTPDGGAPSSSVSSLLMTPMDPLSALFSSFLPSTPNSNQFELPYPFSPPHLASPQSYPCPLFAMLDYGVPFTASPKFHELLSDSPMPTGKAESEYCINKLQTGS